MATATTTPEDDSGLKVSINSHRYVCPICLESMKIPRSLPCLHTFCEDCLQTLITAAFGKRSEEVVCPVCRKQIVAPELGLPRDKWAKSFPINYYMSTSFLMPQDLQSDKNTEIENCRFCERSNKNVPAEHYCKKCAEAICDGCKSFHQNVPSLKNHNILTLEYYKKNPMIPEIDEICPLHPGKVIEVYCLDHSKMCCSVCFATKHRHCKDVKSIEECAEILNADVLKLITTKLESLLKSVEDEIKGKENLGIKRKRCKEEVVVQMTQCIKAAKENLDVLLQKFESDIHWQDSFDEMQLQNLLKILQWIKTSVMFDKQILETATKFGSKTQVFVALEKVKIQMNEKMKLVPGVDASKSLSEGYTVYLKEVEEICRLKSIGISKSVSPSRPAETQGTLSAMQSFMKDADYLKGHRLRTLFWNERLSL